MPKRVFAITAGIMRIPIVGNLLQRTVYKFLKEKVESTKNPYDNLALDVIWGLVTGDIYIAGKLQEFIFRMAEKETVAGKEGTWSFMANAFIHETEIQQKKQSK